MSGETLTLTPATVTPQEAPDASGTGYGKRQRVKLHIDGGGSVASFRTSAQGTFSDQGLPTKPVGQHTVSVRDAKGTTLASAPYEVRIAVPPPTGERSTAEIQTLLDAAFPGAHVRVPAGVYRGPMVTVSKAVSLDLEDCDIRGSDIWTEWTGTGPWTSAATVSLPDTANRYTALPYIVAVDDELQRQVGGSPSAGQFSVNNGRVILGTNPAGKRVEVAIRARTLFVTTSDVSVIGGTLRHSLSPAQAGMLQVSGYGAARVHGFSLMGTTLLDAQGACLSIQNGGDGHLIEDCDVRRGGQLGLHLPGSGSHGTQEPEAQLTLNAHDWTVRRTKLVDCNWGGWSMGWEAGGMKALFIDGLLLEDIEAWGTRNTPYTNGRGIWTDTGVQHLTVRRMRAHDNGHAPFFESARDGLIEDSVSYDNDWEPGAASWGGNILLSRTGRMTVRRNTVARGVDGIRYNATDETDDPKHEQNVITENTILEPSRVGVGWGPDRNSSWTPMALGNRSIGNRYYRAPTVTDYPAFESGSVQLTPEQAAAAYAAAGIDP